MLRSICSTMLSLTSLGDAIGYAVIQPLCLPSAPCRWSPDLASRDGSHRHRTVAVDGGTCECDAMREMTDPATAPPPYRQYSCLQVASPRCLRSRRDAGMSRFWWSYGA